MNLIKNAAFYHAELPGIEAMNNHLAERPFLPIGENFLSSAGFVPNRTTAELVTPIAGGYSFTVRYDEKILPSSAVAQALSETIEVLMEEREVDHIDKEERNELHEKIYTDLVKRAIAKSPVYVNCFYHEESQQLIIPTTSKQIAQTIMRILVQAVGSVKTSTIWVDNVKNGLTTRLKEHLNGERDDAFGVFQPGTTITLREKKNKAVFDVDNLSLAHSGLVEALGQGMSVESMTLEHNGVAFKLAHDFRLKQIDFLEELDEDEREERYGDAADNAHIWRIEAGVQLLLMIAVGKELCDMFGYKPPLPGQIEIVDAKLTDAAMELDDPLYQDAVDCVRDTRRASVSAIQRALKIGFNRAAHLMERLELEGVVTGMDSHGRREVLIEPRQVDVEDLTGKPNKQ